MNKRHMIFTGMVFSLILLTVSSSTALLADSSGPAQNIFTSTRKVDILLREPGWDGYSFDDDGWEHGLGTKDDSTSLDLGFNKATTYMPGDTIVKDPKIQLDQSSEDCYVAMKVSFLLKDATGTYINVDKSELTSTLIDDLVISSNWHQIPDSETPPENKYEIYIFDGADDIADLLSTDGTSGTDALFSEIKVKFNIYEENLKDFEINVNAYAIQGTNLDIGDVDSTMLEFIED